MAKVRGVVLVLGALARAAALPVLVLGVLLARVVLARVAVLPVVALLEMLEHLHGMRGR